MKQRRSVITLGLMFTSVLLLVILQFLWIRGSYEKAFSDFEGDVNLLFRSTVLTLRNAAWMKNMVEIKNDSIQDQRIVLSGPIGPREFQILEQHDSLKPGSVDTIIASRKRGIQKIMMRSLSTTLSRDSLFSAGKSFIVRIESDTINQDSLRYQFSKALKNKSIENLFSTKLLRIEKRADPVDPILGDLFSERPEGPYGQPVRRANAAQIFSDTVRTELVRASPGHFYEATFYDVRGYVFREILPQIVFSLVLTLLVTAAFYLLLKNIRSQARLMEAKNDFINNVTHELKTPVATVSVALEAFRDFDAIRNPALTKEYLDIAQRELARLVSITDKILRTSVMEEQADVIKHESVDLLPVVSNVMASMKVVADATGATLRLEIYGEQFVLHGSSEHLQAMLYNLVDNALKYRSPEKPLVVTVRLERMESLIRISVKDNGIGIHRSFHSRIFEKFFRVPSGDIHNIKGYGLGLNYVGTVVNSHHGSISVNSEPGEGSEFIIILPLYKK